jgi:hypothetical protein
MPSRNWSRKVRETRSSSNQKRSEPASMSDQAGDDHAGPSWFEERSSGVAHFVSPTSACTGYTFTGTEQASGSDLLGFLRFREPAMAELDPQRFVINSNLAMTNSRPVTSLTFLHQVYLFPLGAMLGSADGSRKRPLTLSYKVDVVGRFCPCGSCRGQTLGVGPCLRDAGPGSRAKPSARRDAVTRTRRLRQASRRRLEDLPGRTG